MRLYELFLKFHGFFTELSQDDIIKHYQEEAKIMVPKKVCLASSQYIPETQSTQMDHLKKMIPGMGEIIKSEG